MYYVFIIFFFLGGKRVFHLRDLFGQWTQRIWSQSEPDKGRLLYFNIPNATNSFWYQLC